MNSYKSKLTDRFERALVYATQLHNNQIRKGSGVPYISHLLGVTAIVLEDGGDEDEAIAALLHDAIEDQGGAATREAIRQQFGDRIVSIVDGCTDSEVVPKPPWKERKEKYIEKMRYASAEVRRVSLADKLHNARSILADWYREGDEVWNRFKGGKKGTLWYYRSFINVCLEAGRTSHGSEETSEPVSSSSFAIEELDRVVRQLENI